MAIVSTETAEHYRWGDGCDGWHLVRSQGLSVIQEAMPPATTETPHLHSMAEQFFYVLSGVLSIELAGSVHTLRAGQGLEVPRNTPHRVFNEAKGAAGFLVISAPPAQADRIPAG